MCPVGCLLVSLASRRSGGRRRRSRMWCQNPDNDQVKLATYHRSGRDGADHSRPIRMVRFGPRTMPATRINRRILWRLTSCPALGCMPEFADAVDAAGSDAGRPGRSPFRHRAGLQRRRVRAVSRVIVGRAMWPLLALIDVVDDQRVDGRPLPPRNAFAVRSRSLTFRRTRTYSATYDSPAGVRRFGARPRWASSGAPHRRKFRPLNEHWDARRLV